MAFRPRPRHHLAGSALWAGVAIAGLWPFWPGLVVSDGRPVTYLELCVASEGWLGAVGVGGLLGVLVGVLHALKALDLWLDVRALRRGRVPGEGRAVRLGLAAAIALGALTALGWRSYHDLRVDAHGYPLAMIESYYVRGSQAWRELGDRYAVDQPDPHFAVPADPAAVVPALRRLRTSPLVGVAFHLGPNGRLTLLDEGYLGHANLQASRLERSAPAWPVVGPPERRTLDAWRARQLDDLADRLGSALRRSEFARARTPGPFQHIDERYGEAPISMRGTRQKGFIGYVRDLGWFKPNERGGELLSRAGIPARWGFPDHLPAYVVPAPPKAGVFDLLPLQLVVEPFNDSTALAAHTQAAGMAIAALALLFLAAMIETVRQFRLLIAERAMHMAQSSFVSGVSHEMRTPLATMKLYAELPEQKLDQQPGQREEFVGAILTEVERLHRLVENVLDFARISGRKRTYAFVPPALHGLLGEVLASARGPLQAAGMAVELHCPAPLSAAVDRDALVQAVANLVTNAAKYAAVGGRV